MFIITKLKKIVTYLHTTMPKTNNNHRKFRSNSRVSKLKVKAATGNLASRDSHCSSKTRAKRSNELSLPYIHKSSKNPTLASEKTHKPSLKKQADCQQRKTLVSKFPKKASILRSICAELAKLDASMAKPESRHLKTDPGMTNNRSGDNSLGKLYSRFVERFVKYGKVPLHTLVYSLCLAKKAGAKAKDTFEFEEGEFLLIYASCLYISIKMLNDVEKWFVEDFSLVSGIEEDDVEKMERLTLTQLLDWRANVNFRMFEQEFSKLKKSSKKDMTFFGKGEKKMLKCPSL